MNAFTSPVDRTRVHTTDPDEAAEHQDGFTSFACEPVTRDGFEFSLTTASTRSFGISHMRHGSRFRAQCEPPATMLITENRGGDLRITHRGREVHAPVVLAPHWDGYGCNWDRMSARITTIDLGEVVRLGAAASGLDPTEIVFGDLEPRSPAHARYWSALVDHVEQNVLAHDDLIVAPLLYREAVRCLASGALTVFANSALAVRHTHRPDGAAPATVRRAVAFIDAHAQDDIDIARIADAARLGPRGLQAAFRRHRDQTPLEYLREVRMRGAHRELQAGDPTRGDTVSAIAARWGFTHPGRFSVEYRRAHGYSPSDTLRR